ncbi:MAG: Uma2 family endonuclease [Gemmataceae bacterium]|nr:Uma2 family endonuclease [Gemmataceae bacterium]MCI0741295.1 Uma2 family endonuclease [Gemmataceae bacterium]
MSIATTPTHNRVIPTPRGVLLSGIAWQTYEALLADLKDRPIRLTYDRGCLEIMPPTFNHERSKRKLGRIVETMAEELARPFVSGGSTTFRREDLERGLEPDDCFWIAHASRVLDKQEIDLRTDPPPDLALEIDIHSSSLDRLGIYAALGVPEIWRYDGDHLQVLVLKHGAYKQAKKSPTFPMLHLAKLNEFIRENIGMDDGGFVRAFRSWVRPFLN